MPVNMVTDENIFKRDDDPSGFDLIFEASELGFPPGPPPAEIMMQLPDWGVIKFERCVQVHNASGQFLYWSYWNLSGEVQAINLKILND